MSSFQPSKNVELFRQCLELEPDERARFMEGLEDEDPALFKRLRVLLNAHETSGTFMETIPGVDEKVFEGPIEHAGDQIGRYRLLEKIGEGSWGYGVEGPADRGHRADRGPEDP